MVGLVDPKFGSGEAPPPPVEAPAFADVGAALAAVRAEVAVEFSLPASVYENSLATLAAGVHTVVGATGLGDEQLAGLRAQAAASGARLFVAPNFALGAVLLMEFARQAARHYEHAEVVELHETGKKDAPSGTALRTARLMVEAEGLAHRRAARAMRPPAASTSTACGCTACACPASSPTRRS